MPQLAKGGKWVFGWVIVGKDGRIQIPNDAYEEYGFREGEEVIFTRTSKTSGGFGIARKEIFDQSKLGTTHHLASTIMETDREVILHPQLDASPGDKLLAVRGSYLSLSFLKHGPIIDEAEKHPELEVSIS